MESGRIFDGWGVLSLGLAHARLLGVEMGVRVGFVIVVVIFPVIDLLERLLFADMRHSSPFLVLSIGGDHPSARERWASMKSAEDHGGVVLGSTRSRIDQLVLGEAELCRLQRLATPMSSLWIGSWRGS